MSHIYIFVKSRIFNSSKININSLFPIFDLKLTFSSIMPMLLRWIKVHYLGFILV